MAVPLMRGFEEAPGSISWATSGVPVPPEVTEISDTIMEFFSDHSLGAANLTFAMEVVDIS